MAKNNDYVKLGAMVDSGEKDENGKPIYYIKLDKEVKIKINGQDFNGKSFKVERPTDKFDRMVKKGVITPDEHKQKLDLYAEGGKAAFVKFEIEAKLK